MKFHARLSVAAVMTLVCFCFSGCATQSERYANPVVPGDWSDPAVIRVGDDYYTVHSSLGWQPGIPVLHSKDLVHWRYIGHAFRSNPDLKAGDTSTGIYGLEMGYNPHTKMFLIYAPLANRQLYVYYSRHPQGPYQVKRLGKLGIDPGFFADTDGRLYLVMYKGEIYELEEDGLSIKRMVTKIDTRRYKFFEGPDIFKRNGWYYILFSDGGTQPHQPSTVSVLRSRRIEGPWEADPANPVMFATDDGSPFQGPAHGTLIKTQNAEWFVTYHAHQLSHYSLGRSMGMEPIDWTDDGWWRPANGKVPGVKNRRPNLPQCDYALANSDEFDRKTLGLQWFFHCKPDFSGASWSLTENPGSLRIKPKPGDISSKKSLSNLFLQRVTLKEFEYSTKVSFNARRDGEAAGLHMYHDRGMNFWLVTTARDGARVFEIGSYVDGKRNIVFSQPNPIGKTVFLKISVDGEETASFFISADGSDWRKLDASIYFGDSWQDLRNGKAGKPDLGWIGIKKRNAWSAATFGVFAVRGNAQHTSPADFAFCRVEPLFKNPEPIANSKFTEEEMNEINMPPEKGISLKTVNIYEAVMNFAPGWGVVNCGDGWQPGLRKWWGGRNKVLVTHPVSKDIPCVLRKTVDVPAGKKTTLSIDVGHHPDGDWMLVIKADGDWLAQEIISKKTCGGKGWKTVTVDLSEHAGESVLLELANRANNWKNEAGYWSRLAIESR